MNPNIKFLISEETKAAKTIGYPISKRIGRGGQESFGCSKAAFCSALFWGENVSDSIKSSLLWDIKPLKMNTRMTLQINTGNGLCLSKCKLFPLVFSCNFFSNIFCRECRCQVIHWIHDENSEFGCWSWIAFARLI